MHYELFLLCKSFFFFVIIFYSIIYVHWFSYYIYILGYKKADEKKLEKNRRKKWWIKLVGYSWNIIKLLINVLSQTSPFYKNIKVHYNFYKILFLRIIWIIILPRIC